MPKEIIINSVNYSGISYGEYVRLFSFDLDDLPEYQVYYHGSGGYIRAAKTFHALPKCGLPKRKRKGGTAIAARRAVEEGLHPCKRCKPLGDFPFAPPLERFRTSDGRLLDTLEANRYLNDNLDYEVFKAFSGNLSDMLGEIELDSKNNKVSTTNVNEIEVTINDLGREEVITSDPSVAVAVLNRALLHSAWAQVIALLRNITRLEALTNLANQSSLNIPFLPSNENTEESLKESVEKILGNNIRLETHIEGKLLSIMVFPKRDSILYLHHTRQELNLFGAPSAIDYFIIELDSNDSGLSLSHSIGEYTDER